MKLPDKAIRKVTKLPGGDSTLYASAYFHRTLKVCQ